MITWYSDENITIKFSKAPRTETLNATPDMTKEELKALNEKPYMLVSGALFIQIFYNEMFEKNNKKYIKRKPYNFVIPSKYRWNGANIPWGLWNFIGSPSCNKFRIPSMIHDYLCENHHVISSNRKLSSIIFERLLRVAGVGSFKRRLMYLAVDNFQKLCGWNKK